MNQTNLIGNITRDAQIGATNSGTPRLRFRIAVNDRLYDKQKGAYVDDPSFVDCAVYGKRAEGLAPYMTRGRRVGISGKLKSSSWSDSETGQLKTRVFVIADNVEFLDKAKSAQEDGDTAGADTARDDF